MPDARSEQQSEPPSLLAYSTYLRRHVGSATVARHGLALLSGALPTEEDALLDSHMRALKKHLDDITVALGGIPDDSSLRVTSDASLDSNAELDTVVDAIASWLLDRLARPEVARRLAVVTSRLIEDGPTLQDSARRLRPLGRGFEHLFEERLRQRFEHLPERPQYLEVARRWRTVHLEEPDYAEARIEHDLGVRLTDDVRAWLELERRVATLRRVRHSKTEDSHIRWYVRQHPVRDVVLDRFGVQGHWIVCTLGQTAHLAALCTAVERVFAPDSGKHDTIQGWCLVTGAHQGAAAGTRSPSAQLPIIRQYVVPSGLVHDMDPIALRAKVRQDVRAQESPDEGILWQSLESAASKSDDERQSPRDGTFALRSDSDGVFLVHVTPTVAAIHTVARANHEPNDTDLITFLDSLDCTADLAIPRDEVSKEHANSTAAQWSRALLHVRRHELTRPTSAQDSKGLKVRLVYVPSNIEHQLGGVPLIGLAFLRDRLEQLGARVNITTLRPQDFEHRLPELLGADVVGIGVYIHNVDEVGSLVGLLRDRHFAGRIVLGGPQLRNIDQILHSIDGWDALIRGEGEEVFPRVLQVLKLLHDRRLSEAFELAATLTGVAIRFGETLLLCNTADRNRADEIVCPLPFDWMRGRNHRRLQMNFTRGCPYLCNFCPNHQGQLFRPGEADDLWTYTVLAVADDLALPDDIEAEIGRRIQDELLVSSGSRMRVALHVLQRVGCSAQHLRHIIGPLIDFADPILTTDPDALFAHVGIDSTAWRLGSAAEGQDVRSWDIKRAWLFGKAAVLASRQLWLATGSSPDRIDRLNLVARPAFTLITSEDNTLVNKPTIKEYMRRRGEFGLYDDVIFNPGQNTVWDLTNMRGAADEAYISMLVDNNPFEVALGVDGPSNPVIRQNNKPRYLINEAMAVNRSLARHGVRVANNYILLTPETDFLEAVEAFLLYAVLPLPWRDYGSSINLRVIKEDATLAHDEGLLFAPSDPHCDEPLRFADVARLLERWSITSRVAAGDIAPLLWRVFREDPEVASALPLVVRRWRRDYDSDAELRRLGQLIADRSRPEVPLVDTLWAVKDQLRAEFQQAMERPTR